MKKITYLFGAGASAQKLPVVDKVPERLDSLIKELNTDKFALGDEPFEKNDHIGKRLVKQGLLDGFKWLSEESRKHASIDTYAKKLFITEPSALKNLKIYLSVFFVLKQLRENPDPRYDAFFASILGSKHTELPSDVHILSWNYDHQFELSFFEYSRDRRLSSSKSLLNITAKYSYQGQSLWSDKKRSGFGITKLNGSAGIIGRYDGNDYDLIEEFQGLDLSSFEKVLTQYYRWQGDNGNTIPGLSFSWEDEGSKEETICDFARGRTADTEILVVVGYSFPFFNREVDRQIIGKMTKLERVYFQDITPSIPLQRFKAIRDDMPNESLVPVDDVGQFWMPPEM